MSKLRQLLDSYIDENNYDYALYNQIEKELKALEIIKNNEVDIKAFNDLENMEEYNYYCTPPLNQEEYDLLKETLCNTLKT